MKLEAVQRYYDSLMERKDMEEARIKKEQLLRLFYTARDSLPVEFQDHLTIDDENVYIPVENIKIIAIPPYSHDEVFYCWKVGTYKGNFEDCIGHVLKIKGRTP